jgi:hypothetical protein
LNRSCFSWAGSAVFITAEPIDSDDFRTAKEKGSLSSHTALSATEGSSLAHIIEDVRASDWELSSEDDRPRIEVPLIAYIGSRLMQVKAGE